MLCCNQRRSLPVADGPPKLAGMQRSPELPLAKLERSYYDLPAAMARSVHAVRYWLQQTASQACNVCIAC